MSIHHVTRAVRHPVHYLRLVRSLSAGLPLMYDDVNASNIPLSALIVAGYADGRYTWTAAEWARFPNAQHVTITVSGHTGDKACDCETGDLTPAQAAAWAHATILAGLRPTIYCNTSTLSSVVAALAVYGLLFMRDVDWWQAQYDGIAELTPVDGITPVAKQYLGYPGNSPGPYDVSVTNGVWPATATPTPSPSPSTNVSFPGSSSMGTTCVAYRPSVVYGDEAPAGTVIADVFHISAANGLLYHSGNDPAWVEGTYVDTPGPTFEGVAGTLAGVMAVWRPDGSALDCYVTCTNGITYINSWVNWVWGDWDPIDSDVKLPE
jgi:hypothetical protein